MKRASVLAAMLIAAAFVPSAVIADDGAGTHKKSSYYRKDKDGTRVRGYVQRRGGYSYSYGDVINTYGDSRTRFGGANVFRDPMLDRQSSSGPFDHGFFFDSGTGRIGGDAPYFK